MGQQVNGNVVAMGDHPRARAKLTPQESATVLTGCRDLALERMARALGGMLDRVEDELFGLAEKSSDREMQNVFLDARAQAREKRSLIEATFRQHFAEFFNRKVRGESAKRPDAVGFGELSLVGDEDLEESIAVSEMSKKLKAACEGELFALSQRMGFLLERPELEDDANPVSPAAVCEALKDACDTLQSSFKVRMALLRQLERHAETELQNVYRDLNDHLVERRILPDVRPQARRAAAHPASREAGARGDSPQDLFATLSQLMGGVGAPPGTGGAPSGAAGAGGLPSGAGMPAGAPFMEALTRMHRESPADLVQGGGLVNVVREVKSGSVAANLGTVDAMTIDIVAMLFDYVFEDRHIPDSVKAMLGRLQIPTLKVALLDKSFFSTKTHPARRLIDLLAEASIGLDESCERGLATLKLVEECVERVLLDFETDLDLFGTLVARVEAFIEEGRVAEEAIIQRSAGVIEAREREEIARVVAEEEVARRLAGRAWVPPVVREMLEQDWTRALAQAQAASGEGSPAWDGLSKTADDLLWSVEPKVQAEDRKRLVTMLPRLLRELQGGFERAALTQDRREAFLASLVDCHAAAVKAGLRGIAAVPPVAPPAPIVVEEPARIERELLPAGDVQVEEIRLRTTKGLVRNVFTRTGIWTNVQRGTWVEFARSSGHATRARLTWISPNKGVYLFTNASAGAAAISISPEALAEQMRMGEARILDDAPLVDRAVDSMIASLRREPAGARG